MKFIDADKLRALLVERYNIYKIGQHSPFRNGKAETLRETIELIDSLQQEQPEADLEKEIQKLDNVYFDLDGIAVAGTTYYLKVEDLKDIARHFYGLGLKERKEDKK